MTQLNRTRASSTLITVLFMSVAVVGAACAQSDGESDQALSETVQAVEELDAVDEFGSIEETGESEEAQVADVQADSDKAARIAQLSEALSQNVPGATFSGITESEIPGLFEVITDGQVYYVNEAADYLIDGALIRLSDRANLTDRRLGGIHMGLIDSVDEKDMLIYEPETPSDRSITVFTDISCGFCRRLHAEIDTLLDAGVRVRYLLFPRAGLGSQGHKDLESVWCADNPQEAMTAAKAGGEIATANCDNPIEMHVALAQQVGLRGTPLIYTDSGEKMPGYREAAALTSMITALSQCPDSFTTALSLVNHPAAGTVVKEVSGGLQCLSTDNDNC